MVIVVVTTVLTSLTHHELTTLIQSRGCRYWVIICPPFYSTLVPPTANFSIHDSQLLMLLRNPCRWKISSCVAVRSHVVLPVSRPVAPIWISWALHYLSSSMRTIMEQSLPWRRLRLKCPSIGASAPPESVAMRMVVLCSPVPSLP